MKITPFYDISNWQTAQEALAAALGQKMPNTVHADYFCGAWMVHDAAGRPLATCVLLDNPHLSFQGGAAACFGHFMAKNEPEAVHLLLQTARQKAQQLGKSWLIGPMNGSTWDDYRWAVSNSEFSYLLDIQQPAYYPALVEHAGAEQLADYFTNLDTLLAYDTNRRAKAERLVAPLHLRYRDLDLSRYDDELSRIYAFCMSAFRDNFLFTPISEPWFKGKYLPLQAFIQAQYVLLAEDAEGQLKGLIFAVPNYADTTRRGLILKTIARHPSPRYAGLGTVLGCQIYDRWRADGGHYILHAFMEQSNNSNNLSEHFSGEPIKKYRLWAFPLATTT
jgi:hypothetical protein